MLVPDPTGLEGHYAVAYENHYSGRDIRGAVDGYAEIAERYPDSPEAGYSRAQILNILTSVVPPGKVLAAHLRLIREEIEGAPRQR